MNFSTFIARRYLFSTSKKSFINILSVISVIGVAVGTMALVIVLSVFNGLEDLLRSIHGSFDPELSIQSAQGKSFEVSDSLLASIKAVEGVAILTQVVEDNAYVRYDDSEMVVTLKGVSDEYIEESRIKNNIITGQLKFKDDNFYYGLIGQGVQYGLNVRMSNDFYAMQFFYPRDVIPGSIDPNRMVRQLNLRPGAVFAIEKQYDESYVVAPIEFARQLFGYQGRCTALEIKVSGEASIRKVQQNLKETLGDSYFVLNRDEQHADLLKAIQIEKFFLFIVFSFILLVASFNIFFSLTMLAIDKKRDIEVLYSLGATKRLVQRIFLTEGAMIALSGALLGLGLGYLIIWLQQLFGLVPMGMQSAVVTAYPVKMLLSDFLFTVFIIVVITMLASWRPAIIAARFQGIENL